MPSEYKLKNGVLDANRLQKHAKKIIEDANEDRSLALEAYRYFKNMVDENPQDSVAKAQMVDCLKLAQTSKTNIVKVIDLVVKIDTLKEKEKASSPSLANVFNHLESLSKHD
tara:strand:+ start:190 stop:525 length:336 start_codon:yes stop_codon:yes gene_type:complete